MTTAPIRAPLRPPGVVSEMYSYALDVWFDEDAAVLTDGARLLTVMREAAAEGHASIVGEASAIFPNGAVTAVLLLAQSHLNVHTWPELRLANFDLLTCGRLHGELILSYLQAALQPTRANLVRTVRHVHGSATIDCQH